MQIRDIVNRDVVNIDNCESEPIHLPGSIQPHGFLLGLEKQDHNILYCSHNTVDFLQVDAKDLLGKPYKNIFDCEDNLDLHAYLASDGFDAARPYQCSHNGKMYNVSVHYSGDVLLMEFEPFPDGRLELPNLYLQTQKFLSVMQNTLTLKQLCQSVAEEIKKVTGYDRVMVYRFDKDYNGEVFAEDKQDDIEAFLGLHYPHTDIPAQARALYLQNLLRVITDVNYAPSAILTTVANADNSSLNLSNAVLRSVSPIHVEYLKNMGVGATMTISLISDGKLWGLIACHHYSAKNIPHYVRLTALLEGNFLSSQIQVREASEQFELTKDIDTKLQRVLNTLNNTDVIADYVSDPELLELVNADGVAIISDDDVFANGVVPDEVEILKLADWLQAHKYSELITDNIGKIYSGSNDIAESTVGVLYASLNKVKNNCVIWFRPELEKTITWAGEPDKAIIKDEKRLSPRKSFAGWKQIVKGHSKEWLPVEVNAANKCVYALQKQFTLIDALAEEEKQRKLSEKLRSVNEELSNLNWIGSHDLKEPLRKIQVFASKMLDSEHYDLIPATIDLVERMRKSANRMQNLIEDILDYSRMSNTDNQFVEVDINTVIDDIREELDVAINEKNAVITVATLPVVSGIRFQVRQLLYNLITNALKFAKASEHPAINISCAVTTLGGIDYYAVKVSDNGIGFDKQYEEQIFKVFQRLNNVNNYEGTGIGLAICKKVMDIHHGFIEAKGHEGRGADFIAYFPVNQLED